MIRLLYITFSDLGSAYSGSGVRPRKMLEAFQNNEKVELVLLQMTQRRSRTDSRQYYKELSSIKENHPDICYVEPPSGPIINSYFFKLLNYLKKNKIPVGLFVRDAYWLFEGVVTSGSFLKDRIISFFHWSNLKKFKKLLNICYVPTPEFGELLDLGSFVEVKDLPPGTFFPGSDNSVDEMPYTGIYVGGLNPIYGVDVLIEAIRIFNSRSLPKFQLFLVCREAEWNTFRQNQKIETIPSWLQVLHLQGDEELEPVYRKATISFCPHKTGGYVERALSIKCMEYISYLKPLVVTNSRPMARLVNQYEIGLVVEQDPELFAESIEKICTNRGQINRYKNNLVIARAENLWEKRAEQVVNDLLEAIQND